jgi:hypothetical protein
LVFGFSLATVLVVFFLESYPFLAITSPVPSDTLVVESWINEYAMKQAAASTREAIIRTFLRLVVRPWARAADRLTTSISLPV